jgi:hypothetical protein
MPSRGAVAADLLLRRACVARRSSSWVALPADVSNLRYVGMSHAVSDPEGWLDATNGDIVLPASGVYAIFANAAFTGGVGGRQIQVHLNPTVPPPATVSATNTLAIAEQNGGMPTNGANGHLNVFLTRRLAAGARLRLAAMSEDATSVMTDPCTRMGAVLLMP